MREFAKYAYFAIMYMDQYCPGLGVGVKAGDFPHVRYLDYDEEWDLDATSADIQKFKEFTDVKLREVNRMFDTITQ